MQKTLPANAFLTKQDKTIIFKAPITPYDVDTCNNDGDAESVYDKVESNTEDWKIRWPLQSQHKEWGQIILGPCMPWERRRRLWGKCRYNILIHLGCRYLGKGRSRCQQKISLYTPVEDKHQSNWFCNSFDKGSIQIFEWMKTLSGRIVHLDSDQNSSKQAQYRYIHNEWSRWWKQRRIRWTAAKGDRKHAASRHDPSI